MQSQFQITPEIVRSFATILQNTTLEQARQSIENQKKELKKAAAPSLIAKAEDYELQNKWKDAIETYSEALKADPDNLAALDKRLKVAKRLGGLYLSYYLSDSQKLATLKEEQQKIKTYAKKISNPSRACTTRI